jgi:hypothetical protein
MQSNTGRSIGLFQFVERSHAMLAPVSVRADELSAWGLQPYTAVTR